MSTIREIRALPSSIAYAKRCFFSISNPKTCSIKDCIWYKFCNIATVRSQKWERTVAQCYHFLILLILSLLILKLRLLSHSHSLYLISLSLCFSLSKNLRLRWEISSNMGLWFDSGDSDLRPSDLLKISETEIHAEMMKRHFGPSMGFVKLRLGVHRTPVIILGFVSFCYFFVGLLWRWWDFVGLLWRG